MTRRVSRRGARLSPDNVRPGLRICGYAGEAQDRVIQSVQTGRSIAANGVASGRTTYISWHSLSRYFIVESESGT